jgi:hypothetical protein
MVINCLVVKLNNNDCVKIIGKQCQNA